MGTVRVTIGHQRSTQAGIQDEREIVGEKELGSETTWKHLVTLVAPKTLYSLTNSLTNALTNSLSFFLVSLFRFLSLPLLLALLLLLLLRLLLLNNIQVESPENVREN